MTMRGIDVSHLVAQRRPVARVENTTFRLGYENDQSHQPLGPVKHLVFHWTAGSYLLAWDGYHYCIVWDPIAKKPYAVRMLKPTQKGKHLWGRNTGAIGISFCAMVNDKTVVTAEMIELASALAAEICLAHKLNPAGELMLPDLKRQGSVLVPTGKLMAAPVVADHAFFAKQDGYYPDRWDIGKHMADVARKTEWYYGKLTSGARAAEFGPLVR